MKKAYYLPRADREEAVWLNNFDIVFEPIAPSFGFTPAEITAVHNDCLVVNYVNSTLVLFKSELQERTRYKDLLYDGDAGVNLGDLPTVPTLPVAPAPVPAGVFKRIAKIVQRIKTHPNYNEAIGKNLGIIGHEKTIDLNTIKPVVTVKSITSDSITLDFIKGNMEGVAVFAGTPVYTVPEGGTTPVAGSESEAEMNWAEIARVAHSPFIDTRSNSNNKPETRYYKMRYLKKDVLVGQDSDIIRLISTISGGADLANKLK
jgi:hypothetical protein